MTHLGKYSQLCPKGPFTLAKTKIQKTWVFCCTVYTARKTHNIQVFWHEKRMREKHIWLLSNLWPSSFTCCFIPRVIPGGTQSACAKNFSLPSTFDRTRVVRITLRAAVGWFRWRSGTTWPKTRIIPCEIGAAFTLAKTQWNTRGVSKNPTPEVGF